jgi:3-phenylpropionate/trans-cinnamate dioxygenase ferredoxin subunit
MTDQAFVSVARVAEIAKDSSLAIELGGQTILICHSKDRFFAVANRCSHANEALACGRVRSGWISCPVHGARFELETGRAMNPPATRPIATYPLRITGEWIEIAI